MYRFKLKEIEVGDTEIRKGVKSTVTDIDPETGAIEWDVASTADFSSTYKALQQAREFLNDLDKKAEQTKMDPAIDKFAADIANLFNAFRSHIRKNYPEEYERVLRLKEQSSTATGGDAFAGGEGAQYATPFAFRKKGKKGPSIYYYKLGYKPVPKKIKGSGIIVKQLFEYSDFQSKRIAAFNEIEKRLNNIYPLLSNAKDKTAEIYSGDESNYQIVYPTDYVFELLDEIEAKLNI